MKIVKLTVENIMRVSSVEITPQGSVIVIGGDNAQGKSSILTAIEMALGGKGHVVDQPVRQGEASARVVVDLGEIVIERVFNAAGGTTLKVKAASGAVFQSPQSMLDALVGKLAFDPLAFARAKPKDQAETLRAVAGIDTKDLDERHRMAYALRTEINRDVETLKFGLAAMPEPAADLPDVEPDVPALMAELDAMQKRNEARGAGGAEIMELKSKLALQTKNLAGERAMLDRLEAQCVEYRASIALYDLESIKKEIDQAQERFERARAEIEDSTALRDKIADSQRIGFAVRAKINRAKTVATLEIKTHASGLQTGELEQIAVERHVRIAKAPYPIPGLLVGDDLVTLNGIPLAQASSAEQLRTSVAIGAALNPKLKVMIIRDGSLLDNTGLESLAEIAETNGMQCWVERVSKGAECSFVIEDGHLA